MCYLFGMTHTHRVTRKQLNAVLKTVNKLFAVSQPDGFGFALQNADGSRYVERYVEPKQFAGVGVAERVKARLPKNLAESLQVETVGEYRRGGGALIVHGRTSTNTVSLTNTHPFTKAGWTLAHNGIVSWPKDQPQHPLETSCDTEHILNCFAHGKGLEDCANLEGYAAFLALSPAGDLKVFRDDTAPLCFAYFPQLETTMLASREHIIKAVAGALRMRAGMIVDIAKNTFQTFPLDVANAEGYTVEKHNGIKWGSGFGQGACRAFGYHSAWEEDYVGRPNKQWGGQNWKYDYRKGVYVKDEPAKNADDVSTLGVDDTSVDLDTLNDDEWEAEMRRRMGESQSRVDWVALRALRNTTNGSVPEQDDLEADLLAQLDERERQEAEAALSRTRSIHTMTDEELQRYGLD